MERRCLGLYRLADETEHLRGGSLVEARIRRLQSHRFKHVGGPETGDGAGQ